MKKYYGFFDSKNDIRHFFEDNLEKCNIIFAAYENYAYEGYAFVIFDKNNKLYEVHATHCSCYGLEGQSSPEETTIEALKKLAESDYDIIKTYKKEILMALEELEKKESSHEI